MAMVTPSLARGMATIITWSPTSSADACGGRSNLPSIPDVVLPARRASTAKPAAVLTRTL